MHKQSVELVISDDGLGMQTTMSPDQRNTGFGLAGMRERALALGGSLEIFTSQNVGTTILAKIPLGEKP